MTWAAPLWLLGLLPWSAVVLYLLWGRRRRTDVPFLDLWQGPAEGVRVRRRVAPPPVALALAVLAMLLAVLAAGQPEVPWPGFVGENSVAVVLDRGYTMSARQPRGDGTRLAALLDRVGSHPALRSGFGPAVSWVVPGPAAERVDISDLGRTPAGAATALDTRDPLRAAVRSALARDAGPVLVLSDQDPGAADERLVHVVPTRPVLNMRIVTMAARETPAAAAAAAGAAPSAQVMVRVRTADGYDRLRLRVVSGRTTIDHTVEVKPRGETDLFFDLPALGQTVKAELLVNDDVAADDTAWLVREASWPRLEARAPLPAHVQRMVEVYARSRPAADASRRVILVGGAGDLPAGEPGIVVVEPAAGEAGPAARPAPLDVRDHPVTRGVAWADVGAPAVANAGPPPGGWTPVVSAGGKAWVAVRERPIRAVWVGLDTAGWARSPEFVVFWANVFNWAGAGGERFASYPVGSLEGHWRAVELAGSVAPPEQGLWPGLYRRADGTLRAMHAPDVPFPAPRETDWRERLARLQREARSRLALAPVLSLLALVCLLLSAIAWKRRGAASESERLPLLSKPLSDGRGFPHRGGS